MCNLLGLSSTIDFALTRDLNMASNEERQNKETAAAVQDLS